MAKLKRGPHSSGVDGAGALRLDKGGSSSISLLLSTPGGSLALTISSTISLRYYYRRIKSEPKVAELKLESPF